MKLLAFYLGAIFCFTGAALGQSKDDSDQIRGTWLIVSIHEDGKEQQVVRDECKGNVPIKDRKLTLTFENGKLTARLDGKIQGDTMEYKLDSTKSPKWIDVVGKRESYVGIYELNGDTLRICHGAADSGKRPSKFASEPNSPNKHLAIMKREKP